MKGHVQKQRERGTYRRKPVIQFRQTCRQCCLWGQWLPRARQADKDADGPIRRLVCWRPAAKFRLQIRLQETERKPFPQPTHTHKPTHTLTTGSRVVTVVTSAMYIPCDQSPAKRFPSAVCSVRNCFPPVKSTNHHITCASHSRHSCVTPTSQQQGSKHVFAGPVLLSGFFF